MVSMLGKGSSSPTFFPATKSKAQQQPALSASHHKQLVMVDLSANDMVGLGMWKRSSALHAMRQNSPGLLHLAIPDDYTIRADGHATAHGRTIAILGSMGADGVDVLGNDLKNLSTWKPRPAPQTARLNMPNRLLLLVPHLHRVRTERHATA